MKPYYSPPHSYVDMISDTLQTRTWFSGRVELVHVAVNVEDYSTMGYGRQEGAIQPGSDPGSGSQDMTSSGHIPMIWSLTTPNSHHTAFEFNLHAPTACSSPLNR